MKLACLPVLMLSALTAQAGGRARYGGTLPVVLVTKQVEARPLFADSPTDAVAQSLTRSPLCQLVTLDASTPGIMRLTPALGVSPDDIVEALARVGTSDSPYRALLSGVASWKRSGVLVELTLNGPTADLPRGLCHPAFGIAPGPFHGPPYEASAQHPAGRPFLDGVTIVTADKRTAERLLAERKADLVVGLGTASEDVPQLFVTVLILPPAIAPHLSAALQSTVDRADLVRFFLPPPASPLHGLLPATLGGPLEASARPSRPAPLKPDREIAVAFDTSSEVERALAERLQVKLQPLGYRVALKPLSRQALRARSSKAPELTLQSLALPASPIAALAVLVEASGQHARVQEVLAAVAAAGDPPTKARQLALELAGQLPLVPLVTRGVGVTLARDLQHLTRDAAGLPRLDELFYAPE